MTHFQMAVAYFFAASSLFGLLWAIFGYMSTRGRGSAGYDEIDYRSMDRRFRGED